MIDTAVPLRFSTQITQRVTGILVGMVLVALISISGATAVGFILAEALVLYAGYGAVTRLISPRVHQHGVRE